MNEYAKEYTPQELESLIAFAVKDIHKQLQLCRQKLQEAEMRQSIAEWAVVGVMSLRLELRIMQQTAGLDADTALRLAREIARNAAYEFIHKAELAFKDHAELARLKMDASLKEPIRHVSAFDRSPSTWPNPLR